MHTKPSKTQRPFGNYWASVMLRGPDFIAKLSEGLKIIDPIFITCDDIGKLVLVTKIVSEYDQEIPQSQTADNPVAPRGRAAQPSRDTRKTN